MASVAPVERSAIYWSTGAVAGVASSVMTSLASRIVPSLVPPGAAAVTPSALRSVFFGAGMRFLAFDLTRDFIKRTYSEDKLVTLRGAISGGVGGLSETLQSSLATAVQGRSLDALRAKTLLPHLGWHGSTLFLCFGSYTFLSTTFSPHQTPPSTPTCFFLGALAGAFGVPAIHALKEQKLDPKGLARASATGFVRVGTVIGCQVIASARLMEWLEGSRAAARYEGP